MSSCRSSRFQSEFEVNRGPTNLIVHLIAREDTFTEILARRVIF